MADHILDTAVHILVSLHLVKYILAVADHILVNSYLVNHILAVPDHILVNPYLVKHILAVADHILVIIKEFLIKDNQLHLHFKCFLVNFLQFKNLLTVLIVKLTFMLSIANKSVLNTVDYFFFLTIQIVLAFLKVIKILFINYKLLN